MRYLMMAAAILLAPVAASAADAPSENIGLAKRVMAITGGTDNARASVPQLADTMANSFTNGARDAEVVINPKALARAVKAQVHTFTPQFVNAGVQAYARVYTATELRQLIAYLRKNELRRGKMPKAIVDKAPAVAEQQAAMTSPLRAKLTHDLFTTYCARTPCNDNVRKVIATFGHS